MDKKTYKINLEILLDEKDAATAILSDLRKGGEGGSKEYKSISSYRNKMNRLIKTLKQRYEKN